MRSSLLLISNTAAEGSNNNNSINIDTNRAVKKDISSKHNHSSSYHSSTTSDLNNLLDNLSVQTSIYDMKNNDASLTNNNGASNAQKSITALNENTITGKDLQQPYQFLLNAANVIDNAQNDTQSVWGNDSLIRTDSHILNESNANDEIILNTRISSHKSNVIKKPPRRRRTQDSIRTTAIPFQSSKHSQIVPFKQGANKKGSIKSSASAQREIDRMKKNLLSKRDIKRKHKKFLMDDDNVIIGNKITEGHVNFIIAYNMLTGIRVAVSRCSGLMKPLTLKDFKFYKKLAFDYHGNELTPSSQYAFKFKDYCPEVFRELRGMFGLDPADYLVSLTSKYILSELNSPGKSGSFFYYSRDFKFIIKTIHHSEHIRLRKTLQDYYNHVKTNPDTLICQFYGLHRIKMPISFKNKIKHRKIYFIVMNNLFPPHLDMHITFDLKGSTLDRYTKINEKESKGNDSNYRPILKDLNWLELKEKIKFGPIKKEKFLLQLRKDLELLSKLNIMDYSLLFGIHDMNKYKQENDDEYDENNLIAFYDDDNVIVQNEHDKTEAHLQTIPLKPHYFKQFEGGIRASNKNNDNENLIYYFGIIDCLTHYSIIKKLETFWKSLNNDINIVSAVPPKDYSRRLYRFIENSIDTQDIEK
ncbi:hypothetical protein KAFR_0B06280 [Kazachstania africana CBS 2517]|uniref:1-phosphatidylinositol-4-phosphate 5-kinase n=1 Tax=Kazachstania africana (strain ATCC 22294 / BCRC 22015 / CBS 2517 / CECT 1963 / NBRC 1671 / NRRL Y-8276) TaxID=1071382 RepID=H2ARC5_KAZAF|nr:hypothetical protein KAFR_0B06280 [Kazachstania africana CBS 2517]CCF56925.1 hypothetical protein KAFR_0B06280 [Kazachstania africana CBS 2517]